MLRALTSRIQSPDIKGFFKFHFFPPSELRAPSRGPPMRAPPSRSLLSPPSPKDHHFSLPWILSQSSADSKMEDWGRGTVDGGLEECLRLGSSPAPYHCTPHPPGPILAVCSSSRSSPRVRRRDTGTRRPAEGRGRGRGTLQPSARRPPAPPARNPHAHAPCLPHQPPPPPR